MCLVGTGSTPSHFSPDGVRTKRGGAWDRRRGPATSDDLLAELEIGCLVLSAWPLALFQPELRPRKLSRVSHPLAAAPGGGVPPAGGAGGGVPWPADRFDRSNRRGPSLAVWLGHAGYLP